MHLDLKPPLPKPVADKLSAEIIRISKTPEWTRAMGELGAIPETMGPADFNRFVRAEVTRWGDAVKAANVKVD